MAIEGQSVFPHFEELAGTRLRFVFVHFHLCSSWRGGGADMLDCRLMHIFYGSISSQSTEAFYVPALYPAGRVVSLD